MLTAIYILLYHYLGKGKMQHIVETGSGKCNIYFILNYPLSPGGIGNHSQCDRKVRYLLLYVHQGLLVHNPWSLCSKNNSELLSIFWYYYGCHIKQLRAKLSCLSHIWCLMLTVDWPWVFSRLEFLNMWQDFPKQKEENLLFVMFASISLAKPRVTVGEAYART